MKTVVLFLSLFFYLFLPLAFAVDVAPRIGDREIIESLAELKEGQRALNQRLDDLTSSTDRRFDDMNKRFDDVNKRFDDMNKRFDDMNRRFDTLQATLWLFISIVSIILGAMGKILWEHQKQLTAIHIVLETHAIKKQGGVPAARG